MEQAELQPLYDSYHRKIAKVDLRFKRYLYSQINWKARIISIKGARGVGKTTMLLQHILENYEDIDQTLYASLDNLWFATHSLMDLVRLGGPARHFPALSGRSSSLRRVVPGTEKHLR